MIKNEKREKEIFLKPRERLFEQGPTHLSDQELLAILLRTGSKNQPVMSLAMAVLQYFESFYQLGTASINELMVLRGIGKIKAIELVAAIELGKRVFRADIVKYGKFNSVSEITQLLEIEMRHLDQEHLMVFYLNIKNEILKKETVFIGTLNSTLAHPREIFRGAVKYSAARILVSHNHPSG